MAIRSFWTTMASRLSRRAASSPRAAVEVLVCTTLTQKQLHHDPDLHRHAIAPFRASADSPTAFYIGWKVVKRTKLVPLAEIDFMSGRRELDEMDEREQARFVKPTSIGGRVWGASAARRFESAHRRSVAHVESVKIMFMSSICIALLTRKAEASAESPWVEASTRERGGGQRKRVSRILAGSHILSRSGERVESLRIIRHPRVIEVVVESKSRRSAAPRRRSLNNARSIRALRLGLSEHLVDSFGRSHARVRTSGTRVSGRRVCEQPGRRVAALRAACQTLILCLIVRRLFVPRALFTHTRRRCTSRRSRLSSSAARSGRRRPRSSTAARGPRIVVWPSAAARSTNCCWCVGPMSSSEPTSEPLQVSSPSEARAYTAYKSKFITSAN